MNTIELTCGPCGNVLCSQYGCQKQRHITPNAGITIVPQGCICPPTSEQTCGNLHCPRKPHRARAGAAGFGLAVGKENT